MRKIITTKQITIYSIIGDLSDVKSTIASFRELNNMKQAQK